MSQSQELPPKYNAASDLAFADPTARVKQLANYGNTVDIDPNVPIRRYYRSGLEMVRMGNVYEQEGSFENAYILYMKFMTLFIEKIRKHPEYSTVNTDSKTTIQEKLHKVMPKAEKLKKILLDHYTKEHNKYLEEQAKLQALKKKEDNNDSVVKNKLKSFDASQDTYNINSVVGPDKLIGLDSIVYPDDFPNDQKRPNLPDGLVLQDPVKPKPPGPSIDRSVKPTDTGGLLGGSLRSVLVPSGLMDKFLALARSNTDKNIETCGILAGQLSRNKFAISHVILPKQCGTSDSCTTMNEEEIFDFQDQHGLITLGWIHTHPSQTAFLSSVDLHTHCSYQTMMPEAVAIVCAPKYQETGCFCLTPQYGLEFIQKCRQQGFHPHPNEPPLFMTAPHVQFDKQAPVQIMDLR
uniref:Putative smad6 n=1 Tax=Xenopsylla cheopis TaxID=163159 RepID=A0A6M2DT24_XENCH